jgi:hypothetical protein
LIPDQSVIGNDRANWQACHNSLATERLHGSWAPR